MKHLFALTTILGIAIMSIGAASCASRGGGLGGTFWRLTSYGLPSTTTPVLTGTAITLNFDRDGSRVTGSSGCNEYFGDCLVKGKSITISNIGATKKACADPPGIMVQENAFFELLGKAERFSADCCGLTIFCDGGELHFVSG